ncbi:hypothetical protein BBJ28_00005509 [Nothophytophthora sp. Chile5]|nr:hypothetical protein BBJ28_00005509 [Nothophytophthora sp. Chile5]
MLPRSKAKDERTAAGATAAATICDLCDLYTRNDLDGKWTELAAVYDRMAVGEYEPGAGANASDLAAIKRESRLIKQALGKILANGRSFKAKRDELDAAMAKQRDALAVELEAAKEFLGQAHLLHASDSAALEVGEPAPVEQRLRATVKPPELSPTVDLSEAPFI